MRKQVVGACSVALALTAAAASGAPRGSEPSYRSWQRSTALVKLS